jgi:hypothetical protein
VIYKKKKMRFHGKQHTHLFFRFCTQNKQPEVGGLIVRMPLEVELRRNARHSQVGLKFSKQVGEETEMAVWYARAQKFLESEMQALALTADEEGQIDATSLSPLSAELLRLYLDTQETWQEVCLVTNYDSEKHRAVVINRPMAMKLTEHIAKLVLFGAFVGENTDEKFRFKKDLVRFMMAFGQECAVYVGGPDEQDKPATMIHGISNLEGARELCPGCGIYEGGIPAAVTGILDGRYNPLEFRFFVGCHAFEESSLDVQVLLGKYQPIACARSLALKQCISLPKPLWSEGTFRLDYVAWFIVHCRVASSFIVEYVATCM